MYIYVYTYIYIHISSTILINPMGSSFSNNRFGGLIFCGRETIPGGAYKMGPHVYN